MAAKSSRPKRTYTEKDLILKIERLEKKLEDLTTAVRQLSDKLDEKKQSERKYVYGIKGLAGLLGCSVATAQRIKSGGAIDGSYVQRKKEIIFDAEKVLQFFDDPDSRWGIVYLWSRRFVSPAGHFDCSFGLWGESWGESETENRPLKQMRSRLRVPRAGIEPARYCYHRILSPARLPIPPSGLVTGLQI